MIEVITNLQDGFAVTASQSRKVFADNPRGLAAAIRELNAEKKHARDMGFGTGRIGSFSTRIEVDGEEVHEYEIADARTMRELLAEKKAQAARSGGRQ